MDFLWYHSLRFLIPEVAAMPRTLATIAAVVAALLFLSALACAATAQTNLRAHAADGQVWVVWTAAPPWPETYGVYASDTPISDLAEAELVGRPFAYEYFPGAIRDQFGPGDAGWVIPAEGGGVEALAGDQALFVETIQATTDRYYAVVAWGESQVTPGVNATTQPVAAVYAPDEPVTCHFQGQVSTAPGYVTRIYALWADGRQDPGAGRPDFPVMANRAKNGMPSIFLVSARDDLGPGPHPVAYWLHGGQGRAKQSTPGSRTIYGIDPDLGLLVAHNDDLVRRVVRDGVPQVGEEPTSSWWFGWGVGYDPFVAAAGPPPPGEMVVNYTQRRLAWIHQWLVDQDWVDPARASILGHSMGSAGATALGKVHPDAFGSVTVFNNGFGGPEADEFGQHLLGLPQDSLHTNLVDVAGDTVPVCAVFDLTTPVAASAADLPLFRAFHGKNDTNPTMQWDARVVREYVRADSLGLGAHLYWDERPHAPSPEHPGHWAAGAGMDEQTQRDNVAYQERHRADRSFPAFHDHRLLPGIPQPGDGDPDSGDPWGTWGGYHDWDPATVEDTPTRWAATIFLIGLSAWPVDNCPVDSLICDLVIRRPQAFRPDPGAVIAWEQVDVATGDTLRGGTVTAGPDGRVRLADVVTYRDPRRTRLGFRRAAVAVGRRTGPAALRLSATPNPCNPRTMVRFTVPHAGRATVTVHDLRGRRVARLAAGWLEAGPHATTWNGRDDAGRALGSGVYVVRFRAAGAVATQRLTLVR
jgi:hypothetical protein